VQSGAVRGGGWFDKIVGCCVGGDHGCCEKRLIFGFSGKVKKFWDRKNGPILRSHVVFLVSLFEKKSPSSKRAVSGTPFNLCSEVSLSVSKKEGNAPALAR
jgi:hypothetical protein